MEAVYIRPEDIGASGYWSEGWLNFIEKLGYNRDQIIDCILILEIKPKNL